MLAYAEDVRWCEEEGIRSVADLAGRVVLHQDDERLWRKRCMEFNDIGCGEQIERIRHTRSLFVGLVDHHDALHLLFVDPFRSATVNGFGERIERIRHVCSLFVGFVDIVTCRDVPYSLTLSVSSIGSKSLKQPCGARRAPPANFQYPLSDRSRWNQTKVRAGLQSFIAFSILYRIEVVGTERSRGQPCHIRNFQYPLSDRSR